MVFFHILAVLISLPLLEGKIEIRKQVAHSVLLQLIRIHNKLTREAWNKKACHSFSQAHEIMESKEKHSLSKRLGSAPIRWNMLSVEHCSAVFLKSGFSCKLTVSCGKQICFFSFASFLPYSCQGADKYEHAQRDL